MSSHESATVCQEIERKFLTDLDRIPDLSGVPRARIVQGYISGPDESTEVRLRQKGERFFLTMKRGQGLARQEAEITLSQEQFDALWPFTAGRRVEKMRHASTLGEHTLEIDVYEGSLSGLATVEIEFSSVAASEAFVAPAWLGSEKTDDERFKNRALAFHGLPDRAAPDAAVKP